MEDQIRVIALVLNWRDKESTVSCVDSIIQNTEVYRVVIIDNASGDLSVDHFKAVYGGNSKVDVIENDINSGYGGGNNFGINFVEQTYGQDNYIWIVNNDSYIRNNALESMIDIIDDESYVGSVIVQTDEEHIECYGGGKLYPLLGKAKLFGKGTHVRDISKLNGYPDYIMGCSLLLPPSFFKKVGYFDEKFFMYSEEIDLQKRAYSKGYIGKVSSSSFVYHYGSKASDGKSASYFYYRNRAAIYLNIKHFSFFFSILSALFLSVICIKDSKFNIKKYKACIRGIVDAFSM